MINEEYAFFAILKRYCDKKEWTVPTAQIEKTLDRERKKKEKKL